jgi:preprotein translocase subunit YajC
MQALGPIVPMILIFGVFYLLAIRPQIKRQKEQQAMVNSLGKGDEVITRGGLIGKITGIAEDGVVVLELQEKVRVRILRAHIEGKWTPAVSTSAQQSSSAA